MQGQSLPFWLVDEGIKGGVRKGYLQNGQERIPYSASVRGDSIRFAISTFDPELILRFGPNGRVTGTHLRPRPAAQGGGIDRLPVEGFAITDRHATRFGTQRPSTIRLDRRFRVTLESGTRQIPAIGLFDQRADRRLEATILTATGDYRHLEGELSGDSLYLSTLDGAHAYLIKGRVGQGGKSFSATMWSGTTSRQTLTGEADPAATLEGAGQASVALTSEPVSLSLPDTLGRLVTLDDPAYKGRPVIIQIMGTWCPNCLDEAQFLTKWLRGPGAGQGVTVLGVSFERTADPAAFRKRIGRLYGRVGMPYQVLLGGATDTADHRRALPFLDRVAAYPTTLFLDASHRVRFVHSGFAGPATGIEHERHRQTFEAMAAAIAQP